MIIRAEYKIEKTLIEEALVYANLSKAYTSDRHDFHMGGLEQKKKKMFEGKLGEKIFKMFLNDNKIEYKEDSSSYTEADYYDFILPNGQKIDVKTRTQNFHTRTLEMVEQFKRKPKDIYVSVRLFPDAATGKIIGWVSKADLVRINRIENNGYLDNYSVFDNELRSISALYETELKKFKRN